MRHKLTQQQHRRFKHSNDVSTAQKFFWISVGIGAMLQSLTQVLLALQ